MNFGIYLPNFGEYANPNTLAALANEAEEAGWDGFFLWDHVLFSQVLPLTDPWIGLAAMALKTKYIRLGPLVTPIPRRHLEKLARESVALDQLSGGRMIQGVGIGGDWWRELSSFGNTSSDRTRAAMLDEGLTVLIGLWSGNPFSFQGNFYQIDNVQFLPPPLQQPRIPIWLAAVWPNTRPLRRAAQWDGVFPLQSEGKMTPNQVREMVCYIQRYRTATGTFDVVLDSQVSEEKEDVEILVQYAAAGVTWWLESFKHTHSTEMVRKRILQGPPEIM